MRWLLVIMRIALKQNNPVRIGAPVPWCYDLSNSYRVLVHLHRRMNYQTQTHTGFYKNKNAAKLRRQKFKSRKGYSLINSHTSAYLSKAVLICATLLLASDSFLYEFTHTR